MINWIDVKLKPAGLTIALLRIIANRDTVRYTVGRFNIPTGSWSYDPMQGEDKVITHYCPINDPQPEISIKEVMDLMSKP